MSSGTFVLRLFGLLVLTTAAIPLSERQTEIIKDFRGQLSTDNMENANAVAGSVLSSPNLKKKARCVFLLEFGRALYEFNHPLPAKTVLEQVDEGGCKKKLRAEALAYLGAILERSKEGAKALDVLNRALALDGENWRVHYHLAHILSVEFIGLDRGKDIFREGELALALGGDKAAAMHPVLAAAHLDANNLEKCIEHWAAVLNIDGRYCDAMLMTLIARKKGYLPEGAKGLQTRMVSLLSKGECKCSQELYYGYEKNMPACLDPMNFMYLDVNPESKLDVITRRASLLTEQILRRGAVPFSSPISLSLLSKVRLAYVSPDGFLSGAAPDLIDGLFEYHNPRSLEVHCYSLSQCPDGGLLSTRQREWALRFTGGCVTYTCVETDTPETLSQRINSDNTHVLLETSGYSSGLGMQTASLRPARVQVNVLETPTTVGAAYIQYSLGSVYSRPPELDMYNAERTLMFPGSFMLNAYRTRRVKQEVLLAKPPIPRKHLNLCMLGRSEKVSLDDISAWMKVVSDVPGLQFVVMGSGYTVPAFWHDQLAALGLDRSRLRWVQRTGVRPYFTLLSACDLVVDTRVYNGCKTTLDGIWAGSPTVTVPQNSEAGRFAVGLTVAAGNAETVMHSMDEATRWATAYLRAINPVASPASAIPTEGVNPTEGISGPPTDSVRPTSPRARTLKDKLRGHLFKAGGLFDTLALAGQFDALLEAAMDVEGGYGSAFTLVY